ncbi:MAG: hypothetical protein HKN98_14425 [Silicimonas sp.]|nr:hypothetical protein [Silicimonas sp.]NND42061.1 hypothetical protein [Silicimonas sp.]NNL34612.1 hypothetical protein [Silicimonas sp.]NNL74054.1 hypothetical protein [Silicimonas sp.]RZW03225.1 MAG: hypothetical protein EX266_11610 [Paracoccaceae bacterium]
MVVNFSPLFVLKKVSAVNLPDRSDKGDFAMGMLPTIPMFLLGAVAIWFFWPLIVDPIARATNPSRRDLRRDADRTADLLFETWAERG